MRNKYWVEEGECFIFIRKEDKPVSLDSIMKHYSSKDGYVNLGDWSDDWSFDGKEVKYVKNFWDRARFALTSLHEDTLVIDTIIKHMGSKCKGVKKLYYNRHIIDNYLKNWMDEFGFTLEDFLFNDKYIVVCDDDRGTFTNFVIGTNCFNDDGFETGSYWSLSEE